MSENAPPEEKLWAVKEYLSGKGRQGAVQSNATVPSLVGAAGERFKIFNIF